MHNATAQLLPPDFSVIFASGGGTDGTPHQAGTTIQVGPGQTGEVRYWAKGATWRKAFAVEPPTLADLYGFIAQSTIFDIGQRNERRQSPPGAAAPDTLTVVVAGQTTIVHRDRDVILVEEVRRRLLATLPAELAVLVRTSEPPLPPLDITATLQTLDELVGQLYTALRRGELPLEHLSREVLHRLRSTSQGLATLEEELRPWVRE